jgi:SET domain-containing protein
MMLVRTYLGPSGIHGVGVFAGEPIERGAAVWARHAVFDLVVTREMRAGLPDAMLSYLDTYSYPAGDGADGRSVLDCDNGRYMNHSDTPNTSFKGEGGRATSNIEMGAEITCDYREFFPKAVWERMAFLISDGTTETSL